MITFHILLICCLIYHFVKAISANEISDDTISFFHHSKTKNLKGKGEEGKEEYEEEGKRFSRRIPYTNKVNYVKQSSTIMQPPSFKNMQGHRFTRTASKAYSNVLPHPTTLLNTEEKVSYDNEPDKPSFEPLPIRTELLAHLTEVPEGRIKIMNQHAFFFGTLSQFFIDLNANRFQIGATTIPEFTNGNPKKSIKFQKPTIQDALFQDGRKNIIGKFPKNQLDRVVKLDTKFYQGRALADPNCPYKAVLGMGNSVDMLLLNIMVDAHPWIDLYKMFWDIPYGISLCPPNTVSLIERLLVCSETYGTVIVMSIPPFLFSGSETAHFDEMHPYLEDIEAYNSCPVCNKARQKVNAKINEIRESENRLITKEEMVDARRTVTGNEIFELTKAENYYRLDRVFFILGAYNMGLGNRELHDIVPKIGGNPSIDIYYYDQAVSFISECAIRDDNEDLNTHPNQDYVTETTHEIRTTHGREELMCAAYPQFFTDPVTGKKKLPYKKL